VARRDVEPRFSRFSWPARLAVAGLFVSTIGTLLI
jgi:hypothetical protein